MAATTIEAAAATSPPRAASPLALVVADAGWFTTEHLFGALDRPGTSTLLLRCFDYRVALQRGWPPWRWNRGLQEHGPRHWRRDLVLPTGWMKSFPRLGMRPIRRAVVEWRRWAAADGPLVLVMTYPHYLYLRDLIRPDRTIYYNIDDYAQYWPSRAATVGALERRAARESDLSVCVSSRRCEELRRSVPEAADRVRHLPHGAPALSIAARPWHRPAPPPADLAAIAGPRLGYVGTLEDRVDWSLLDRVAALQPGASVVLLGRLDRAPRSGRKAAWREERRRCLARPNVHLLGWRPQAELAAYVAAFDVCLIPYRVDHPFNLACNPTKIMDFMGSGRPIVATALPECRAHAERFHVAGSPEAFLDAVAEVLAAGSDDGRAALRHAHALAHRCDRVAARLLDWLGA